MGFSMQKGEVSQQPMARIAVTLKKTLEMSLLL